MTGKLRVGAKKMFEISQ